ncbi:MAG: cupin domain-containing protein [Proteobacteria bacterium]|nr:cupin domain-containing protein [Pseudomonadota bacterium]MBU1641626.1 cupin domain-containing protein [Pseudomonadota bacterium]
MVCLVGLLLSAPISVLAGKESQLAGQDVANLTEAIAYSAEGFVKKPIFKGENYVILLFAFQKGQRLEAHTIAIDAFVQVLEGSALVAIDGKEYVVAAGEKISLPKNLSHALTAKEDFKMLLVK